MEKISTVDNSLEKHLRAKRDELIWALSMQDYTSAQIGRMFNLKHRSTVMRIIKQKPANWKTKWTKSQE